MIYRSIKTNYITQRFGENLNDFYAQLKMKGHNGIDFLAKEGEELRWDKEEIGRVYWIGKDENGGIGVEILSYNGKDYRKSRFWHLKNYVVYVGQELKAGDLIGYADNTGLSTGTHLHRDEKPCDQYGSTLSSNNGYRGCIDFYPEFKNVYIQDMIELKKLTTGYQITGTFKEGDVSPQIAVIKRILQNELPWIPDWSITNYFGKQTKDAVQRFQLKYKTEIDKAAGTCTHCTGTIGTGTGAVLNKILKEYLN